jgi:hypothetical protein
VFRDGHELLLALEGGKRPEGEDMTWSVLVAGNVYVGLTVIAPTLSWCP